MSEALIVLHLPQGGRVGSIPLTPANRRMVTTIFSGRLIQKDAEGTEHYQVFRAPTDKELAQFESLQSGAGMGRQGRCVYESVSSREDSPFEELVNKMFQDGLR